MLGWYHSDFDAKIVCCSCQKNSCHLVFQLLDTGMQKNQLKKNLSLLDPI